MYVHSNSYSIPPLTHLPYPAAGGEAATVVTSAGGQAITLAGSAGGVVTSFGGSVYTEATSAANSAASAARSGNSAPGPVSSPFSSSVIISLLAVAVSAGMGALVTL